MGLHTLPKKPSSSQCIGIIEDLPATKLKQTLSAQKMLCTVIWDRRSILLVDILTRDGTVNTERYCETLQKLRRVIHNKRRGMISACVVLLHDNARPHTAQHICRSSAGRYLIIIHPIAWILHPVISIFSHISRNSCPVSASVFRMTERWR